MGMIETIARIFNSTLDIGTSNVVRLTPGSGKLSVNNTSDTLIPVEAGTPSADGHLVTKGYADTNYGVNGAVREIAIAFDWEDATALGTATMDSTAQLPSGAVVQSVDLKVLTDFDGGVSLEVGNTSSANAYMTSAQNAPGTAGTYSNNERAPSLGSADDARVTITASGTPSQGEAVAYVSYSVPQS